eukprot:2375370-Rhodomonas_salina.1
MYQECGSLYWISGCSNIADLGRHDTSNTDYPNLRGTNAWYWHTHLLVLRYAQGVWRQVLRNGLLVLRYALRMQCAVQRNALAGPGKRACWDYSCLLGLGYARAGTEMCVWVRSQWVDLLYKGLSAIENALEDTASSTDQKLSTLDREHRSRP